MVISMVRIKVGMGSRKVRIGLTMVKTVHHSMARMVTKIDKIFIIIFLRTSRMVIVMIIVIVMIRIRMVIGWSLEWVVVSQVRMGVWNLSILICRFKGGS